MKRIVWLASYPKSGNTWLRLALQSLKRSGRLDSLNEAEDRAGGASARLLFDQTLNVESSDLTPDEALVARPRAYEAAARLTAGALPLKVHDAWTLTPAGEPLFSPAATMGVVYIVRDPRDVAPSFSNRLGCSIDVAIDRMADSNFTLAPSTDAVRAQFPQRLLSWSEHVTSWLDAPGAPLLVVRYEQMIADMNGVLADVARFIGMHPDEATVHAATRSVEFSTLRAKEDVEGFNERKPDAGRFFRRGVAGGWRDELTPEQAARVTRDHEIVMRRLGYLGSLDDATSVDQR